MIEQLFNILSEQVVLSTIILLYIIIIIAIIKWLFIKSAVKAGTKEALTELYRLYRYDMEQAEKKQQVEDNDNHLS